MVSAFSASRHYVVVRFDGTAPDAVAEDFLIEGPERESLPVVDAQPGEHADEILLTPGAQEPVTYSLTFAGDGLSTGQAAVIGDPTVEPTLPPVPSSFRLLDPGIPTNAAIIARIQAIG